MNMKKTLAGVLAGAVAVSAMATMAMAADEAFVLEFGSKQVATAYTFNYETTGAYVLPTGDITFDIAMPAPGYEQNADWNKATITVEGYTADGKSTTAATYTFDKGFKMESDWENMKGLYKVTVPVTDSKYGTGLNVSAFENCGQGAIITKIKIENICAGLQQIEKAAADVKSTLTSAQVKAYVPAAGSGFSFGENLTIKDVAATKAESKTEVNYGWGNTAKTFDLSTLTLKNSQKRIIKEGATAALTITLSAETTEETILKYKVNGGDAKVFILPAKTKVFSIELTNADLYKAAAGEDDDEAFLGKVEILSAHAASAAKLTVTPANAAADDETTTPDGDEGTTTPDAGEGTTTPDAGEDANPPMGVAPVALAVLPVALAAAVVAKKRS